MACELVVYGGRSVVSRVLTQVVLNVMEHKNTRYLALLNGIYMMLQ